MSVRLLMYLTFPKTFILLNYFVTHSTNQCNETVLTYIYKFQFKQFPGVEGLISMATKQGVKMYINENVDKGDKEKKTNEIIPIPEKGLFRYKHIKKPNI